MIEYWCIGKTNNKEVQELEKEFTKRINGFYKFNLVHIESSKIKSDPMSIKQDEFQKVKLRIKPGDYIILLDENGLDFTSRQFAAFNEKLILNGSYKRLIYISGGAYGFDTQLIQMSRSKVKLSSMTFSHQLIRIIFLEQLYRAFTIIHNHPYHND